MIIDGWVIVVLIVVLIGLAILFDQGRASVLDAMDQQEQSDLEARQAKRRDQH